MGVLVAAVLVEGRRGGDRGVECGVEGGVEGDAGPGFEFAAVAQFVAVALHRFLGRFLDVGVEAFGGGGDGVAYVGGE
ncbi:MAG: hypothetical protein M0026_16645 [Nocardiopsaceae bacterium]|nr:hypothetical protein [Nocardiopsaceae bacterium]